MCSTVKITGPPGRAERHRQERGGGSALPNFTSLLDSLLIPLPFPHPLRNLLGRGGFSSRFPKERLNPEVFAGSFDMKRGFISSK